MLVGYIPLCYPYYLEVSLNLFWTGNIEPEGRTQDEIAVLRAQAADVVKARDGWGAISWMIDKSSAERAAIYKSVFS